MVEYFRNALNYLTASGDKQDNELIGKIVVMGKRRLIVRCLIAEGGFGYVFSVVDQDGKAFALKRMFSGDLEAQESIKREIAILKDVSGHPNVLEFCEAACEVQPQGRVEFLILTELCKGGPLMKQIQARHRPLELCEILPLFYQLCHAVQHLHSKNPPIIHRDLKMENLLLSGEGDLKLCDFGSATIKSFYPDHTWSAQKRILVAEQIYKFTTPMYRAPEILDLYQNYPIDHRLDIWALGCILYHFCYSAHPFQDSAVLRILNAKYVLPENDERCGVLNFLIEKILKVDPVERLNIKEIVNELNALATKFGVDLTAKFELCKEERLFVTGENVNSEASSSSMGFFFDSIKGQAGSILKSIRETSNKMAQLNFPCKENNLLYLTGRLIVFISPDEASGKEDLWRLLNLRHRNQYVVYNFSNRQHVFPPTLSDRIYHSPIADDAAPPLQVLLRLCQDFYTWLSKSGSNVVVLHSDVPSKCYCVVGAFFVFCKLFTTIEEVHKFFQSRGVVPPLTPSQQRYIQYVAAVIKYPTFYPQFNRVRFTSLSVSPVPTFNKLRTGCRPFVEIFSKGQKICTSVDQLALYENSLPSFSIPLDVTLVDDAVFVLYHARATLGTKVQGRMAVVKMVQFQLHPGFVDPSKSSLTLEADELELHNDEGKYAKAMKLHLVYGVQSAHDGREHNAIVPNFHPDAINNRTPFATTKEYNEFCQLFRERREEKPARESVDEAPDFLSSLDWKQSEPRMEKDVDERCAKGPTGEEDSLLEKGDLSSKTGKLFSLSLDSELVEGGGDQGLPGPVDHCVNDVEKLFGVVEGSQVAPGHDPLLPSVHVESLLFADNVGHAQSTLELTKTDLPVHRNLSTPLLPRADVPEEEEAKAEKSCALRPPSAFVRNAQSNGRKVVGDQCARKANVQPSTFEDLLSCQGFVGGSSSSSKQSLASMKRQVDNVCLTEEEVKIRKWTEGKRRNIRGLLCSLHTVVWADNDRWLEVAMSQLVSKAEVKKYYRKACLAVHPDKFVGTEHETLAKLIFSELNDAWNNFENTDGAVAFF